MQINAQETIPGRFLLGSLSYIPMPPVMLYQLDEPALLLRYSFVASFF